MHAAAANQHTAELLQRLNFSGTCAFSKHLAEQLVDSTVLKPGVSRAIVRPSLIAAVAQEPYPGYITGPAAAAAYSMGEVAWSQMNLPRSSSHSRCIHTVRSADIDQPCWCKAVGTCSHSCGHSELSCTELLPAHLPNQLLPVHTGYGQGFLHGVSSVAFSSDTLLDIVPADTVAHLVISAGAAAAATYGSPCADRAAVIFHAAASQSNPLSIKQAFDIMAAFWKSNPPPQTLPATR